MPLFPRRQFALQFVGEVQEEDHVVLRLLRFRRFRRHQRGDAFAVVLSNGAPGSYFARLHHRLTVEEDRDDGKQALPQKGLNASVPGSTAFRRKFAEIGSQVAATHI